MRWILAPLALAATAAMAQFNGPAPLAWRWSESTTVSPAGSPVVDGNAVYVAVGGRIYALDRATGNQLWRYPAGEPLTGSFRTGVSLAGDKVVAATDQKIVYAVNAKSGQLAWQYTSPASIIGAPVATSGEVVFPLADNSLGGVGLASGQPLWSGRSIKASDRIFPNLGVWQDNVVYATPAGLTMVVAATGLEKWSQKFGRLSSTAAPMVYADSIYVNTSTYVVSLRAATGGVRWEKNTNSVLLYSPAVSDQGVASVGEDDNLYVFDLNGRAASRTGFPVKAKAGMSPSWAGRFALIPTVGGTLLLLDPKTGDRVWGYTIGEVSPSSTSASSPSGPPVGPGMLSGGPGKGAGASRTTTPSKDIPVAGAGVVSSGTLLVLAMDGSLLAFDRTNGVDLTPPQVQMLWPTPGDQVSPNPPAELDFKLTDYTSGINPATVKVTINGRAVDFTQDADGLLRVLITQSGTNKNLPLGRCTIAVTAGDWLGNIKTTSFVLLVDAAIDKPLGGPPAPGSTMGGPGKGGPGPGGPGGRGMGG